MFCSNCGKTIRLEDGACQHCGASLGEGLFYGNTYTSCQVRIPAESINNAPEGGMMSYTRTNYMSEQPKDNIYSNTVYRPLLSDEEDLDRIEAEEAAAAEEEEAARRAEEEAARAEEAGEPIPEDEAEAPQEDEAPEEEIPADEPAEEAADEFADEDFEDDEDAEDIPEVSTSPLPPLKKAAISPRVLSYMEELEKQQQRRASGGGLRMPSFLNKLNLKKKAPEAEEELPEAEDILGAEAAEESYEAAEAQSEEAYEEQTGESFSVEEAGQAEDEEAYAEDEAFDGEPAEEIPDGEEPMTDGEYDAEYDEETGEYVSEDESFDSYEDEDEDAAPEKKFDLSGLLAGFDIKALLQNRILKISVAAVLIIAVLIGGITWLNYVTTKRAKIVDVTYSVYTDGIQLLKDHTGDEYRTSMTQVYLTNTGTANQHFSEDMAKFNTLMPAEPAANDPLFITALTIVQDAIVDAIKADADAELNGKAAERAEISERDWLAIEDAVAKIENARTPNELSSIVGNLESIVVPTASPTPAPTPDTRKTLTKGMMDDVDVRYMQNKLVNLGFLEGEADGDFGAGTETAVKAFQRAAGLTADGVVTPAVLDAMEAPDAPHAPSSAAPSNPSAE